MSDNTPMEPAHEAPAEGQVESSGIGASDGGEDFFDYTEYADKNVRLKVDGEEIVVPLAEAVAGYQRQADYTRKTQELATQREQMQFATAIQEALQQDPTGTIELLQQHFGVQAGMSDEPEVPDFSDPLEKQIWEIDQKVQQIEQFRAEQQLQAEIGRLQSKYQDFDPQTVVFEALKLGSDDLEAVYKQMAFDKLYLQMQAQSQATASQQAEEQQILQAKRDAGIIAGGSTPAASAQDTTGPITSIRDAWEAAKRELGGF